MGNIWTLRYSIFLKRHINIIKRNHVYCPGQCYDLVGSPIRTDSNINANRLDIIVKGFLGENLSFDQYVCSNWSKHWSKRNWKSFKIQRYGKHIGRMWKLKMKTIPAFVRVVWLLKTKVSDICQQQNLTAYHTWMTENYIHFHCSDFKEILVIITKKIRVDAWNQTTSGFVWFLWLMTHQSL